MRKSLALLVVLCIAVMVVFFFMMDAQARVTTDYWKLDSDGALEPKQESWTVNLTPGTAGSGTFYADNEDGTAIVNDGKNVAFTKQGLPYYLVDFGTTPLLNDFGEKVGRILVSDFNYMYPSYVDSSVANPTATFLKLYYSNPDEVTSETRSRISVVTATGAYPPIVPLEYIDPIGLSSTYLSAAILPILPGRSRQITITDAGDKWVETFNAPAIVASGTSSEVTSSSWMERDGYLPSEASWALSTINAPTETTMLNDGTQTYLGLFGSQAAKQKHLYLGGQGGAANLMDFARIITTTFRGRFLPCNSDAGCDADFRICDNNTLLNDGLWVGVTDNSTDSYKNLVVETNNDGAGRESKLTSVDVTDDYHIFEVRLEPDGDFIVWVDFVRVAETGDASAGGNTLTLRGGSEWTSDKTLGFYSLPGVTSTDWNGMFVDWAMIEHGD